VEFAPSTSAATRLIEQGGVRINGEKVADIKAILSVGASYLLQAGKRQAAEIELIRTIQN